LLCASGRAVGKVYGTSFFQTLPRSLWLLRASHHRARHCRPALFSPVSLFPKEKEYLFPPPLCVEISIPRGRSLSVFFALWGGCPPKLNPAITRSCVFPFPDNFQDSRPPLAAQSARRGSSMVRNCVFRLSAPLDACCGIPSFSSPSCLWKASQCFFFRFLVAPSLFEPHFLSRPTSGPRKRLFL